MLVYKSEHIDMNSSFCFQNNATIPWADSKLGGINTKNLSITCFWQISRSFGLSIHSLAEYLSDQVVTEKWLADALDNRSGAITHFWKFLPWFFIPITTWNFKFITRSFSSTLELKVTLGIILLIFNNQVVTPELHTESLNDRFIPVPMTRDIKKLNILNTLPKLACWSPVRLCSVVRIITHSNNEPNTLAKPKKKLN